MTRLIGLACGPTAGGRTSAAVAAVLAGARGAETRALDLTGGEVDDAIREIDRADGIVLGSPVYRGTYSAALKTVLERTERGMWGERTAPLQGKAVAVVLTGASPHHFLALGDLRSVLAGFFAAQVLSPGLYLDHSAFIDRSTPTGETRALAAGHGAALHALTEAVRGSPALTALRPQV